MEENKWLPWRPEKYSPEALLEKARWYFDKCENDLVKTSFWKEIQTPKTLSWLCLWLWVAKDYISEKAKDDRFTETIKLIRLEVENDIEMKAMLWFINTTIASKNLSTNFDWREKIDNKNENENINVDVTENLTEDQKQVIAKRYGNK